jgi:hypothetical protein
MPPDLSLDASSAQVTGTPAKAGSYTVTIRASDSQPAPAQVSADYLIEVINP